MTPLEFAGNLARSDKYEDRVLGVAIVTRGVTDDDGTRQGWPLNEHTVSRACEYLGILPNEKFVADVIEKAPQVSDAMLNKGAAG